MGATATLPDDLVTATPGESATCEIHVRNDGQVVDRFLLDVVGDAREWVTVSPAELSVFPGEEGTARITFSPPRSPDVPAGETPFAVRIMSTEDTEGSAVHEGTVVVAEYTEIDAELVPRTTRGSRTGRQHLVIDNKGNHEVPTDVQVVDPEDQLRGSTPTPQVLTEPGTATVVEVKVKPRRRFLRGASKTLPYRVEVYPRGGDPLVVDAAMVQDPVLPRWLVPLVTLVLVVAVALATLWFTVLKPVVTSAAREAADAQNAVLSSQVADANARASEAQDNAASAAAEASSNRPTSSSPAPTTTTVPPPSAVDFRVQTGAPPSAVGSFSTFSYSDPGRRTLSITDLVLQNPAQDKGTMEVRRGNTVLLTFSLATFTHLDYHFTQPLQVTPGTPVVVAVSCQNDGLSCSPAVYFAGTARQS
ncbi:hypothetical protein [Lentzea sp. NPDC059081]|uniref:COG1470 family protein n=1 Tax=Lentzea sp. NPDC059081 TaxID=3346719 RepID=UPI0036C21D69